MPVHTAGTLALLAPLNIAAMVAFDLSGSLVEMLAIVRIVCSGSRFSRSGRNGLPGTEITAAVAPIAARLAAIGHKSLIVEDLVGQLIFCRKFVVESPHHATEVVLVCAQAIDEMGQHARLPDILAILVERSETLVLLYGMKDGGDALLADACLEENVASHLRSMLYHHVANEYRQLYQGIGMRMFAGQDAESCPCMLPKRDTLPAALQLLVLVEDLAQSGHDVGKQS